MSVTIGIDLGTTNSCAAIVQDGRPRILSETGGDFTIPSMVAVDEKGNRLVGQSAKRQILTNPLNTVAGSKRLVGRAFHSKTLNEIQDQFAYKMAPGEEGDVLVQMGGDQFGTHEIAALILDQVRNCAQDILQKQVSAAVVTVPAYFNDRQRQAVKEAGEVARIAIKRIINEPTAAALAYGWGKNLREKIAVYDLGGGTFDISILEVRSNIFEVKATGGDTFLGGYDFDNRIFDFVLGQFEQASGVTLAKNLIALQRVKDACERAKIDLSTKTETRIHIPFIMMGDDGPVTLDVTLTRAETSTLCKDLVERTLEVCGRVLADAGMTREELDQLLLVGGQTRMPLVQEMVAEYFGMAPSKGVHPDEAVAIGAAIMANAVDEGDDKIVLLDVLPMPIGVEMANGKFRTIFERNTPIPNQKSVTLTTSKNNQTSLKLKIFQGESDVAKLNEMLGEFTFAGITPAPKGQAKLQAILRLSPEGIMTVTGQDLLSGATHERTLSVSSGITQRTERHVDLVPPPTPEAAPQQQAPRKDVLRIDPSKVAAMKAKAEAAQSSAPAGSDESASPAAAPPSTPDGATSGRPMTAVERARAYQAEQQRAAPSHDRARSRHGRGQGRGQERGFFGRLRAVFSRSS